MTWSSYFGPLASFEDEVPGGLPLDDDLRVITCRFWRIGPILLAVFAVEDLHTGGAPWGKKYEKT